MTLTTKYDSKVWIREMICESIIYGRESRQSGEEIKFAGLQAGLLLDRSWTFVGQELGSFGLGLDWTYIVLIWIEFNFIFNYHQWVGTEFGQTPAQ
jgi:hypothetical protein